MMAQQQYSVNEPQQSNDDGSGSQSQEDADTASGNWSRYRYVAQCGHRDYTARAQLCERMYLGGGRQWDTLEAQALIAQGRKPREFNDILPSINSAVGHQIKNRLDIQFRARGGSSDAAQAEIRSKIIMQIADQQHLHWKETEVFGDGLIQQRGYFDVRMDFALNKMGKVNISVLDPMDVIPDPDSKTYEPSGWADVCVTRWMCHEEIAGAYGDDKANQVFAMMPNQQDFGDDDDTGAVRAKFSDPLRNGRSYDAYYRAQATTRARVVERQRWQRVMSRVMYYPRTGDFKLAENLTPEVIAQQRGAGAIMTRQMSRRVKWVASTCDVTLHADWSPYDTFTIIPYFAYFRRGQTIGLVDNAIDPQQARNKAFSNFEHILGSAANSGWITEENSITNMKPGELERKGAMTGLHIEVRKGAQYPKKIEPTQVPSGVDRYLEQVSTALKNVTVPDAMRGIDGPDTSGLARQTQQFAAQQQIAIPLDNLGRTRHLMGEKLHNLSQQFMTEEQVFNITEMDFSTGKPVDTPITVNQFDPATGLYKNDLTEGDYDVVVSEQPMAATFEEGQFNQALEMKKAGVNIPDSVMVQSSTLARKAEIVSEMAASASQQPDPLTQAKTNSETARAGLLAAQTLLTQATAVENSVAGMFSATQAANQIAAVPEVAPLADALLKSAGFIDKDAGPIVPTPAAAAVPAVVPPIASNTHPNFPAKPAAPDIGAMAGIQRHDPALGVPR